MMRVKLNPWHSRLLLLLLLMIPVYASLVMCAYHPFDSNQYKGGGDEDPNHPFLQDVLLGAPIELRMQDVDGHVQSSPGLKPGNIGACTRLRIPGQSRIDNMDKFAHTTWATVSALRPSLARVEVCFHGNSSMGLAQCPIESWHALEKGSWTEVLPTFKTQYLDIRMLRPHQLDVSLAISVQEELWLYRPMFLVLGMILFIIAPKVGAWLPSYFGSAMTLSLIFVVLILLDQCLKLLPTGRKSTIYIALLSPVVWLGTEALHYFSGVLSATLVGLGFGEDMFSPVVVFISLGAGLVGVGLAFWKVRNLVMSEDEGGSIDAGTASFVNFTIRVVGAVMLLQTSRDVLFALMALILGSAAAWVVGHSQDTEFVEFFHSIWSASDVQRSPPAAARHHSPVRKQQGKKPIIIMNRSDSDNLKNMPGKKGLALREQALSMRSCVGNNHPKASLGKRQEAVVQHLLHHELYSTFHKSPHTKPLSRGEYKALDITETCVDELVKSKKFQEWWVATVVANNRVSIAPNEQREERDVDEITLTADMAPDDYFSGKYAEYKKIFFTNKS
ncbi:hypothetical protein BDL97_07G020100 [Sphagnum fallax]|nr:hypothetical protein BDL97_07G020100 [Sphagnum fallax]